MQDSDKSELAVPPPSNVGEATDLILSKMTAATKDYLRRFEDEVELRVQLAKNFGAGLNVRALLGLWGNNPTLLAQLPTWARHPDDASSYLLVECWRKLKESTP